MKKTLVSHYAGSIAYGTNTPTSDIDIRGIFMYDPMEALLDRADEITHNIKGSDDGKLTELRKFLKLALQNNPNIMETLFVSDKHIIERSKEYEYLRSIRDKFLSKRIFSTYSGYAYSQIKRLKDHNVWINKTDSLGSSVLGKLGLNPVDTLSMTEDKAILLIKAKGLDIKDFAILVKPKCSDYLKVEYNYTEDKDWNTFSSSLIERFNIGAIFQHIDNNLFGVHLLPENIGNKYNPINSDGSFKEYGKDEMQKFLNENPSFTLGKPDILLKFKQQEYERAISDYNSTLWVYPRPLGRIKTIRI